MPINTDIYLADLILPKGEVHLLGGPSGAGKTRWILHALLAWEAGEDFLGFKSYPVPWVYVAADRSVKSVERTLTGMGIQPGRIRAIPAWDKNMNVYTIMDEIVKSKVKLVVWESFGSFVDAPAQSHQVKQFLQRMHKFCREYDLTIIGIVESPKMKPYERYENPRQRISGAAAWGHFSETIFLVEPESYENATPDRVLHLCPRNAPSMTLTLTFDTFGRLLVSQREPVGEVVNRMNKKRR